MSYSIEEVLRTKFLENSALSDYVDGRFYPAAAPHGDDTPFIVYQMVSEPVDVDIAGVHELPAARIQYSFISQDWKEAREVLETLRSIAIDPALRGTFFGVTIDSVIVEDKRDMGIDENTAFYRHDLDLVVRQQI